MHQFTKESNGYILTITLDENKLYNQLDERLTEMIKLNEDHGKFVPNDLKWEYDMCKVYGDYECDFCTPVEIINDLKEFKAVIENIVETEGKDLWDMIDLKKNGTFKLNCKPRLKEAINGSYWEDSYGWNTLVMRIVPANDTLASIELNTIVQHY